MLVRRSSTAPEHEGARVVHAKAIVPTMLEQAQQLEHAGAIAEAAAAEAARCIGRTLAVGIVRADADHGICDAPAAAVAEDTAAAVAGFAAGVAHGGFGAPSRSALASSEYWILPSPETSMTSKSSSSSSSA